ncbi:response regulator transcription factor [Phaeovulum sp.]|uniref:helix-turn-helix transcriptional regulator n=1 Tax=Phaeovulum sp. TaxID=2934796 RepID=UPI0039E4FE96
MHTEINDTPVTIGCIFVGNSLDFSDTMLRITRSEFGCVEFNRIASLNELSAIAPERAKRIRAIIVNETKTGEFCERMPFLRERFPATMFALAYRQPEVARNLLLHTAKKETPPALGFLPMNMEIDRRLSILRLLMGKVRYIPDELIEDSGTDHPPKGGNDSPVSHTQMPRPEKGPVKLTERERQVLCSVSKGKQNKIIAEELDVSEHTIKLHIHHVIAKLGVNNRTEAAIWYLSSADNANGGPL